MLKRAERVKRVMGVPSVARLQLSPIASPVTNVAQLHNSFCGVEVLSHPAHTDEFPPVVEGASKGATVLNASISEIEPSAGKWRVVHVFCGNAQLGQVLTSKGFSVAAVDLPSCGRIRDGSWVPLELLETSGAAAFGDRHLCGKEHCSSLVRGSRCFPRQGSRGAASRASPFKVGQCSPSQV